MPVAAVAGGLLGLGGSIGGAVIGSGAAKDAASQQAEAAKYAADKQYQASQDSINFQKQQYADTQKNLAPWLQTGTGALSNLSNLLGISSPQTSGSLPPPPGIPVHPTQGQPGSGDSSFGSLLQPYGKQFTAPTGLDMQNDPGYQARLKLGTDALQRSAAARGNLLTGGTAKALDSYAQDYASNEYNNVYNRALTGYTTDYNQFQQNQANQFNRLASLAGVGQTTAGQLAQIGQNTANGVSNSLMSGANAAAQGINNAAAANASGIVGSANAWGGALGNLGNFGNLLALSQMGKTNSGGGNYNGSLAYQDNGMFFG